MNSPLSSFHSLQKALQSRSANRDGFTLVEVVLAVGVVSFTVMPLVAMLAIGLQSVRDTMDETVVSGIVQQIRGEIQQIPFSAATNASGTQVVTIDELGNQKNYYTTEGIKTTGTDAGAYYEAKFFVGDATATSGTFAGGNAKAVKVALGYPKFAPAASQKQVIIPLFVARQPSKLN